MTKPQSHDNYLLLSKTGVSIATYEVSDKVITSGQPYDGVGTVVTSDGIKLDFIAGRKGDESNANWFKNKATGGNTIATADSDGWPSKLNFASVGQLSFKINSKNIVADNVVIGQGHSVTLDRNNWWIASPKAEQLVGSNPLMQILIIPGYIDGVIKSPVQLKFQAVVTDVSQFSMEIISI